MESSKKREEEKERGMTSPSKSIRSTRQKSKQKQQKEFHQEGTPTNPAGT
jgi:hypothetical protein